jgi:hypothetical protein
MELSKEEKQKACQIAKKEVERYKGRFKPERPSSLRAEEGWICEQVFRGSVGDELMCAITLQWNYMVAGSVGRAYQVVHVRLRCFTKPEGGRFLRRVQLHLPQWETREGRSYCTICGDGFNGHDVIEADTSLHEF